ncbi:hypothetical protein K3G39_20085 [Pontibacter sp. HSC-14F20]|uniref:cyclic-phosphate processing receiver domain-containing protein n=1 Tax=Pontibacter sp. HSC-14F20 TaxID=2864136 RepID=UPI001C72F644|nr:cyclic-phosphate processing receiver domain-containing protein [Pontibacter sp. HSC-14F20]MBX0335537.1 hypothetical protein [Pontibacter sp. HSC-14F20]
MTNRKKYSLFLDDIRTVDMVYSNMAESDFFIVRNFEDFKSVIREKGLPDFISFDNDLGLDSEGNVAPDGYAAAKWLVYESGLNLSELKFYVHSANPVASQQIQGLLNNYIKFLQEGNAGY